MNSLHEPRDVVRRLYDLLSGPADEPRDWASVQALFFPDVVLRTEVTLPDGATESGRWTLQEFCDEAATEYRRAGFWEREIHSRCHRFGHIAQVWSSYESRTGSLDSDPVGRGVNAVQLLRRGARWCITGLIFQVEQGTSGIPTRYLGTDTNGSAGDG